jgi:hypothetical protein
MKPLFGAFALSLLAAAVATAPAHAQTTSQTQSQQPAGQMAQGQIPAGSYQGSCTNARMLGGALIAFCRADRGTWQTTGVAEADQCQGDIKNVNGALSCNRATTTAATSTSPAATNRTPRSGSSSAPTAS